MNTPMSGTTAGQRLHALLVDYEFDVAGERSGLTYQELQRAWRARHGQPMTRAVSERVWSHIECQRGARRTCAVSGRYVQVILPMLTAEVTPCK